MGNGLTYSVPPFQRDYSWTDEEWEDLWTDIVETTRDGGEPSHYMGYLVLQSDDDRAFEIIDGQQRLTTLSLIVLAVIKNLRRLVEAGDEAGDNQRRLDQIRQSYIGFLDPVTLVTQSKLSLNRNNDAYFQNYIVPLEQLPQRGFRASEHGLRKAFEWFDNRVGAYLVEQPNDKGVALASFIERMSDRLFFTVITVTDELNAYKVFETLNSRGVRLSATDLLKNYLFTVLHKERRHDRDLKRLEDRWERIVERLGSENFPDFLRIHWNSRHGLVRQADLFKTIRNVVQSSDAVFGLLRDMDVDLETFLALASPDNSEWPADWKRDVNLLRMFSVRQPFPLLLAVKRSMNDAAFGQILAANVVISFRYNVIGGLSPAEQERQYDTVTQNVAGGRLLTARDVISALAGLYPSDNQFRAAFSDKSIRTSLPRNARVVKYILTKLEYHVNHVEHEYLTNVASVEHVYPQNAERDWDSFEETDRESSVFKLGNMTMLEASKNRDVGNADFATKRAMYQTSAYGLTRRLAEENEEWSPERLAARQRWIATQANAIWRISQLSP